MSDENFALALQAPQPTETDYEAIHATVMDSERGRWFLAEYARRNRNADTTLLLAAIERIEAAIHLQRAIPALPIPPLQLADLAGALAEAKRNLAAIKPDAGHDGKGGNMGGEFGAIAKALAAATGQIRVTLEHIQDVAWSLREGGNDIHSTALRDQTHAIGENCAALETLNSGVQVMASLLQVLESQTGVERAPAETAAAPAPAEKPQPQPEPVAQSTEPVEKAAEEASAPLPVAVEEIEAEPEPEKPAAIEWGFVHHPPEGPAFIPPAAAELAVAPFEPAQQAQTATKPQTTWPGFDELLAGADIPASAPAEQEDDALDVPETPNWLSALAPALTPNAPAANAGPEIDDSLFDVAPLEAGAARTDAISLVAAFSAEPDMPAAMQEQDIFYIDADMAPAGGSNIPEAPPAPATVTALKPVTMTVPRPANDPLAPLNALSDEEKIALFS